MATIIRITSITELQPISAPAQVQIDFQVLGTLPDIVQIYADGAGVSIGSPVAEVEITPPENTYTEIFPLPVAGTLYYLQLCPRTETNGVPDNEIDGQSWESFCTEKVPFVTQALGPSPHSKPPAPTIGPIESHQPTLRNPGKIDIHWRATTNFDLYHFMWMDQSSNSWSSNDINSGGRSGVFTVSSAIPKHIYAFKVQGCISKLIGHDDCSDFTNPTIYPMPPGTNSLREFLRLSNVQLNPGIRSLGREAFGAGTRAMMRLPQR